MIREEQIVRNTLSYSLIAHGIPALTLEMGESYVVNEKNIDVGVRSVWNMLSELGLVSMPATGSYEYPLLENASRGIYTYSDQPLSSTSGIIRFLVKPGASVKSGQPFARIYNAFGKAQETLHANTNGIVLGHADSSVVFPGMAVMAFGIKPV
ncbi:MAG: succinylglutamate desuccinylase/aspartoacylase family protein, partial [Gammaproteobacteria bacterium]